MTKLSRDLRPHFRNIVYAEFSARAEMFRAFRTSSGLTQRQLVDAYRNKFPCQPISTAMISRLENAQYLTTPKRLTSGMTSLLFQLTLVEQYKTPENQRVKLLPTDIASNFAKVFNVDPRPLQYVTYC